MHASLLPEPRLSVQAMKTSQTLARQIRTMMDVHLLAVFVPNQLIAATDTNLQHQAVVWCANKEGVELQYFAINDIDLWYEVPIGFNATQKMMFEIIVDMAYKSSNVSSIFLSQYTSFKKLFITLHH